MYSYSDIVSTSSIIISLVSAIIAFSVYRLNMRRASGDVLHRIIERLETHPMREARRAIYALDRDDFLGWDDEVCRKVDSWGAELDVVSTLLSQREDMEAFFLLYGDVVLRSIYQMAPYGNHQRTIRGEQFWLPLQRFGVRMLKIWNKLSKRREYVPVIGLPNWPKVSLSYGTFIGDKECQNFLKKPR